MDNLFEACAACHKYQSYKYFYWLHLSANLEIYSYVVDQGYHPVVIACSPNYEGRLASDGRLASEGLASTFILSGVVLWLSNI